MHMAISLYSWREKRSCWVLVLKAEMLEVSRREGRLKMLLV